MIHRLIRRTVRAGRRIFRRRFARAVLAAAVFLAAAGGVFACRRPVILLGDRAFTLLYGENRTRFRHLTLSLALFRPVLTVETAPGAGPDLAARAAAARSRRPLAVFFPYRYREGARRYLAERPGAAVFILGGRNPPDRPAAALSAGPNGMGDFAGPGGVSGAEGGGPPEPRWICTDVRTDDVRASALAERAGARIARSREDFTAAGPDTPLILFTWLDPALVPRKTLAVFDDSPWTQIGPALKLLAEPNRGPENAPAAPAGLIPSEMVLFRGRGGQKIDDIELN